MLVTRVQLSRRKMPRGRRKPPQALVYLGASGVIAMLIPYAAEIYPVHLRGTGASVVAASSKFGGIIGAALGVSGLFDDMALSALAIAAPLAISVVLLLRRGIDTRGLRLEDINAAVARRSGKAVRSENV